MTRRNEPELSDFGTLVAALARSLAMGTLRVVGESAEKFIHLREGRIEGVFTARSKFRIGEILIDMRAVERADLDRVLAEQSKEEGRQPLGEELLQRGLVSNEDVEVALRHQLVEELVDVSLWKKCSFEFFAGPIEKVGPLISRKLFRVGGSQDALGIVECVRETIGDIEAFRGAAPSLRDVYEIVELPEDEAFYRLLELVDGRRNLGDVLLAARLNRFLAMKLIHRLIDGGYIRALDGRELESLAAEEGDRLGPEKVASALERAYELGARGRDAALRAGEVFEALSNGKRAAERYRDYARLCLESGHLGRAEEGANRAISALPGAVEMRELKVEVLSRKRRRGELASELLKLAALHRERIEYEREAETLARVRRLLPGDAEVAVLHAQALQDAASGPSAARAWVVAAELARRAGSTAEAEAALRAAVACAPRSFRFRKLLVRFLAGGDRRELASTEMTALIAVVRERTRRRVHGPGRGLRALSGLLVAAGLAASPAAKALADALLEVKDAGAAAKVSRRSGRAFLAKGALAEACEALRRVRALFPGDARTAEALAKVHIARGEPHHAVGEFLAAAQGHKRHGDIEEAVRVLGLLLDLRPENREALESLSVYARKDDKPGEAASLGARLGHVLRASGRPGDAVVQYNRACVLDPSEPAYARDLSLVLSEVLEAGAGVAELLPTLERLRERGEHLGVIGASLRALSGESASEGVRSILRSSYEALGNEVGSA